MGTSPVGNRPFDINSTSPLRTPILSFTSIDKSFKMGGGGKVPYPKHVWSPAGGWYAQPANWRGNTLIAGVVMAGIVAVTWKFSSEREQWAHRPEPGQWYASRHWSKQLKQWDAEDRENSTKSE